MQQQIMPVAKNECRYRDTLRYQVSEAQIYPGQSKYPEVFSEMIRTATDMAWLCGRTLSDVNRLRLNRLGLKSLALGGMGMVIGKEFQC